MTNRCTHAGQIEEIFFENADIRRVFQLWGGIADTLKNPAQDSYKE